MATLGYDWLFLYTYKKIQVTMVNFFESLLNFMRIYKNEDTSRS